MSAAEWPKLGPLDAEAARPNLTAGVEAMSDHTAENDALRRLGQIENTAHHVTPTGVGAWTLAVHAGPANGVVIATADLRWLLALARERVTPPAMPT